VLNVDSLVFHIAIYVLIYNVYTQNHQTENAIDNSDLCILRIFMNSVYLNYRL